MEKIFKGKAELKKFLKDIMESDEIPKEPITLIFDQGIGFPQFKITVEAIDNPYFIDKNGQKWMKVNE